jgi:hypothetical protein
MSLPAHHLLIIDDLSLDLELLPRVVELEQAAQRLSARDDQGDAGAAVSR